MLLSVVLLLLLLLVSTTQAGFYGYVFTYTVKSFQGGGLMGVSHATVGFSSCQEAVSVYCGGSCDQIDESSGEWCQKERIWYWSDTVALHQADITYGSWTPNNNNVLSWRYVLYIELRNRSDTGKPNSSPQTTILPALRVPSNCQRNINLLTFDPDGDEVKCRYAKGSLSECNDCTPPSVLNLSSSCSLLFSPTNSSSEGPYAVQLMMEEFPRQNMTLTDFSGVKVLRTTSDFIGKTPLQFVLNVDPAAPSCTEGLYLPRFLPPTPDNGAQIFVTINQMVKIPIRAEATRSEITKLLFSGPHDVLKSSSGPGNFTLSWTASDNIFNQGQSHPICFVVQSNLSSSVFQSELRCVVVTVENDYIIAMKMKISTTLSPSSDNDTIIKLIKDELKRNAETFTMLLPALLLLFLVCRTQASHVYGTMMTYYPKNMGADGSISVILRYKLNYLTCPYVDVWTCSGNCGNQTQSFLSAQVDVSSGEWCQREGIMTQLVPNNSPLQLVMSTNIWATNLNGISSRTAVTFVELRTRSDTGKPNTSPQTTIIPVVKAPSNCQTYVDLLAFDPDGDKVRCRYGDDSSSECSPCTPPPILNLSSSCTLSFSPTPSSAEGVYVIQLVMEDFPTQNMVLTQSNGSQEVKTTSSAISKIPVQFVFKVLPAVPSCSDGLYLPRFLPPTPENGAQFNAAVNQSLEITIRAEATQSVITELLFSGPYDVVKITSGSGNFTLRWTPSDISDEEHLPICFVIQASFNSSVYQSELRCVVVGVGTTPPPTPFGFHGIVNTYIVKDFDGNGYPVIRRVKFSFSSCEAFDSYYCGGNCSNRGDIHTVEESVGEWCQKEVNMSWSQTSFNTSSGWWEGEVWIPNMNGISTFKAFNYLELRNRSDIGKPNSSPQTSVLPAVSVPSNCQRNISLLNFDPDGDEVECRCAVGSLSECLTCSPPSILSVSSSCFLSFSPTSSSNEGPYAVQLMVEDFPRQIITLNDSSGAEVVKTPSDSISSSPLQFALNVLPAVPSCSEGLYLPRFLPPTPQNGLRIYVIVNHLLQITIRTVATKSVITKLLVSGPYNMVKSTSGLGSFTLTWTPSESENYENYPICFVSEASYSGSVYQSEHRCVLVTVIPYHVLYLKMKISTTMSVVKNKEIIEKAVKSEMVRQGMPSVINVHLSGGDLVELSTIAPPNA